ncbi:MAG: FAD-dependent oxidoreductase [Dehalococcoidia bacterium]|nr:FAD-dependent oxidoreductase [Dehalococcoidia bacterium]
MGETSIDCDLLIIGGGLAAAFAAIEAKKAGVESVLLVDKGRVGRSGCSVFAAGVMGVFFPGEDNMDAWLAEAVEGSEYLTDQEQLCDHLEQIYQRVLDMDRYGVDFRKPGGKFERAMGRGATPETKRRMIMFNGGLQMMHSMRKALEGAKVKFLEHIMVTGLLTAESAAAGAVGFDTRNCDFYTIRAKATILASGTCRFKGRQPGHRSNSGDLTAAAFRAGVQLMGYDCTQYNAFPVRYDIGPGMNMYVGLGGRFTNAKGERFLETYDPVMKDSTLLSRLAASMALEAQRGNTPVYMDMTHFTPENVAKLRAVLPLPMKMYEAAGIVKNDRFIQKLEWMVASPDTRGGVMVDRQFRTSLPGLFAAGDATPRCLTQLNCALPGAATSGAIAGRTAAAFARDSKIREPGKEQVETLRREALLPLTRKDGIEPDQVVLSLQEAIAPYNILILRRADRLGKALEEIEQIRDDLVPKLHAYDPHYLRMANEARNMVQTAEIVLRSALARKESRGILREDYPYTDNTNWMKWVLARESGGKVTVETADMPLNRYPLKPPAGRVLHPLWQAAIKTGNARLVDDVIQWVK